MSLATSLISSGFYYLSTQHRAMEVLASLEFFQI